MGFHKYTMNCGKLQHRCLEFAKFEQLGYKLPITVPSSVIYISIFPLSLFNVASNV